MALDIVKGFIEKAIGPTMEEIGLQLSDGIKMRRLRNQLNNLARAEQIAKEQNVKLSRINLKALFPYLEGVALEEDCELQEMWANLFVNYIDSNKNLTMHVFPGILGQLSTNEVKMIAFMGNNGKRLKPGKWNLEIGDFPGQC